MKYYWSNRRWYRSRDHWATHELSRSRTTRDRARKHTHTHIHIDAQVNPYIRIHTSRASRTQKRIDRYKERASIYANANIFAGAAQTNIFPGRCEHKRVRRTGGFRWNKHHQHRIYDELFKRKLAIAKRAQVQCHSAYIAYTQRYVAKNYICTRKTGPIWRTRKNTRFWCAYLCSFHDKRLRRPCLEWIFMYIDMVLKCRKMELRVVDTRMYLLKTIVRACVAIFSAIYLGQSLWCFGSSDRSHSTFISIILTILYI